MRYNKRRRGYKPRSKKRYSRGKKYHNYYAQRGGIRL